MVKANRAISLGISALIVIVLILIVGFGLFLNATFNTTATTSLGATSTSSTLQAEVITVNGTTANDSVSLPASGQITNSTIGLKLELSINSTTLDSGQGLSINIAEYNTLDKMNNVSAAKDWANLGLTLGPCGTVNSPVGASVIQGYYTSSNISLASPLSLFSNFSIYSCPVFLYVRYYLFQPISDYGCMYVVSGNETACFYLQDPGQLSPISGSLSVRSYWDQANMEHNLGPGIYTVVGGDEWGDIVILHFRVVTTVSTTITS